MDALRRGQRHRDWPSHPNWPCSDALIRPRSGRCWWAPAGLVDSGRGETSDVDEQVCLGVVVGNVVRFGEADVGFDGVFAAEPVV